MVAEAFHTIGSEYERLCMIVLHMTKVQAANVISRLPAMPFLGKVEKVKSETKLEIGITSPTQEAPRVQQVSQMSEVP